MNFQESCKYINSLNPFYIKPGLSRIKKILNYFDNPQDRLNVILVGGTNGKGSVCCFLDSIFSFNGYKTALFTSPHLINITERIKINNFEIDDYNFSKITAEIKNASQRLKTRLTFFEFLTAMFYIYAYNQKVHVANVEVGMGGRWDATNIVKNTICSVITNIDFDHTEFLGETIENIAYEKSGIIKKNGKVITATKNGLDLLKKVSSDLNSSLFVFGKDFSGKLVSFDFKEKIQKILYAGKRIKKTFTTTLLGYNQVINLSLALFAAETLRDYYNFKEFDIPVKKTNNPARFQIINKNNKTIIIDGAHNVSGIKMLIKNFSLIPKEKYICCFAVLKEKDYNSILKLLANNFFEIYITKTKSDRDLTVHQLEDLVKPYILKNKISIHLEPYKLFDLLIKNYNYVVFTGSLYHCANVLNFLKMT